MGQVQAYRRGGEIAGYRIDFHPRKPRYLYADRGIGFGSEKHALKVMARIEDRMARGGSWERVIADYHGPSVHRDLVTVWFERHIEYKRQLQEGGRRGGSPGTIRNYESALREYIEPYFKGVTVQELTFGSLDRWSLWLSGRGLRPKSVANAIGYMKRTLRWIEESGDIPGYRAPRVPSVEADQPARDVLEPHELDAVLAAIPWTQRGIFLLMASTGVRPQEARVIQVRDIHDPWIDIRRAFKGQHSGDEIGETKTPRGKRKVLITDELDGWLREFVYGQRIGSAWVFENPDPRSPGSWSGNAILRTWVKALKDAGVRYVKPYAIKHSYATECAERGANDYELMVALGHTDIRSTHGYIQRTRERMTRLTRPGTVERLDNRR
jgi:integrase